MTVMYAVHAFVVGVAVVVVFYHLPVAAQVRLELAARNAVKALKDKAVAGVKKLLHKQ
jgi:hypothetical protein